MKAVSIILFIFTFLIPLILLGQYSPMDYHQANIDNQMRISQQMTQFHGDVSMQYNEFKNANSDYSSSNPSNYFKNSKSITKFDQGVESLEKGNWLDAITCFSLILKYDSKNADAFYGCGIAYDKLKKIGDATECYTNALTCNPNFYEALHNRGNDFLVQNKFDSSIADFSRPLNINTQHSWKAVTYYSRAVAYYKLGLYSNSIDDCNLALKINPSYSDPYICRGLSYYNMNLNDNAIFDFIHVTEINPNNANAHYFLGLLYDRLKLYQKAIAEYSSAIYINPEFSNAIYSRSLDNFEIQKYENTVSDLSFIIKLDNKEESFFIMRGRSYTELEQYDKALDDFKLALQINPNEINSLYYRGLCYYKMKQLDNAINDFTSIINKNPKFSEAYYKRGLAIGEQGQYIRSIYDLFSAYKVGPPIMDFFNKTYFEKNEKLTKNFRIKLLSDQKSSDSLFTRGYSYFVLRKFDKSLIDFSQALENNHNDLISCFAVGIIKLLFGNTDEGCDYLNKAKDIDQNLINSIEETYCH